MSDSDAVVFERKGQVCYITLNRPDALNALSVRMETQLMEALEAFRDDREVLVAVLTGAGGRAFSAGMDLKEVAEYDAVEQGSRPAIIKRFAELDLWKPIIAAVDGHCVAGGLEIAMQCDIRIATNKSRFGLPEPRWNLMANYYGCHNLSRMIPLGEALYMQLTGNSIDAATALRNGLVHSVHADRSALLAEADTIADAITYCAPLAVQAIKKAVMVGRNMPVDQAYDMGGPMLQALMATQDGIEGPKAFSEKRRPVWKMR